MLKVDREGRAFQPLTLRSLPDAGWRESDLQKMIANSSDAFFAEMGEDLILVGEEVRPADVVEDRIDLLALDRNGAAVIIELKRGTHKLQLLQALSYASMISRWEPDRFVSCRQLFSSSNKEIAESEIEDFAVDVDRLNESQRVILIAEDFDFSVLVTAEWLRENYGIDIRCYRLAVSIEDVNEYLNCTCIFPPPELKVFATPRGRAASQATTPKWASWDDALSAITNPFIVVFYRQELTNGRESNLSRRLLHFRVNNNRRFFVAARRQHCYVWQHRRFEGDELFWKDLLGTHINLSPKKNGVCLKFTLSLDSDFSRFRDAVDKELSRAVWVDRGEALLPDEVDEDEDE